MKLFCEKQKRPIAIFMMAVLVMLGVFSPQKAETVQAAQNYPYKIMVNKQMCVVTVYEKDAKGKYTIPVKAMLCSPGVETPLGTYKTPAKYRWRLLMDDVWGQYSTRIVGGILFHSVWYYEQDPSTLSNAQFNKLGTRCSHGCVRLNVEDAKWIYDNCPIGTEVTIYESADPGPLGKPEGIKVSQSTLMGYDPTDIWSEGNPYIKAKPVIKGVKNKVVSYGQKVNPAEGVTAITSTGEDFTNGIKISIQYQGKTVKKIKPRKTGLYYVTYEVTDKLGKNSKTEAIFEVVDDQVPKIKGLEKEMYLNTELDKEAIEDGVTVKWHGKEIAKEDLSITWVELRQKETLKKYKVTYSYTADNGKTGTMTAKIICDLEAPEFIGVKDGVVGAEEELTRKFLLSNVMAVDNTGYILNKNVEVIVEKQEDGIFKVVYRTSDAAGNIAEAEAIYEVVPEETDTADTTDTEEPEEEIV